MAEFDLIHHIRQRARSRDDVALGIGDDAALLRVPVGKLLVVATDTLNIGVHFPEGTSPADIGWKSLAVNLSDLAAMGATPAWCTLSLSLPQSNLSWVDEFLDGFFELAEMHNVALIGGDTTRGPLSICVTMHGFADESRALLRSGAQTGDDIWVTGTLGDAAGALAHWKSGGMADLVLRQRLNRPTPRIAAGLALVDVAHACIDVSDGLLADLGHVCVASGVGAEVDIDTLPASAALRDSFDETSRRRLQTSGGDDYELCFTAPPTSHDALALVAQVTNTPMTKIGRVVSGSGVRVLLADGSEWAPPSRGYEHFARHPGERRDPVP